MKDFDLRYLSPITFPFVLWFVFAALMWVAGVDFTQWGRAAGAVSCLIFGIFFGVPYACMMDKTERNKITLRKIMGDE